jgi:hypothetical protein
MRTAITIFAALLAVGCSRREAPPAVDTAPAPITAPRDPRIPTQADIDRFLDEGRDSTLRKISALDYYLQFRLLQATGLVDELGGEDKTAAALLALGDEYERRARVFETEMPKMINTTAFTGEGMTSGFTGMGLGSFVGLLTGGMTTGMVGSLSDEELAGLSSKGPMKYSGAGSQAEMQIGTDGSVSQSMEFDVNDSGMNGKVKVKTRMTACPDVNGKLEVEVDVDSQMTVKGKDGVGGSVHSTFKYERYLDDDANLITTADGSASSNHIRMGGIENFESQYVDLTIGYERGGERIWNLHDEGGFSIFRPEEVERTRKLLEAVELLQSLVAEAMLRGIGGDPPWASGRCIDLKVTSDPAKRTELDPATPFNVEAKPRVKEDGSPANGTVKAALSGGSSLTLNGTKIKADAKYVYVAPEEVDQDATITFESRSKRGIGKAQFTFDTRKKKKAYSISGGAGEFHGTGTACDLAARFFIEGSGVTVRFEPSSAEGGRYSYSGNMSGFQVWGNGTYTVGYQGDVAVSITSTGPGSVKTPKGTFSRTGSETYALTPLGDGPCVGATD